MKLLSVILVALTVLAAPLFAAGEKESGTPKAAEPKVVKPIEVKISSFDPPNGENSRSGDFMAEYLREKSGGVIQMKVYPGATLTAGSQKASIEQTQLGTIQGVLYAYVFKNRPLQKHRGAA